MRHLFLLVTALATFIYSCKKDKKIEPIIPTPPNIPTTTYPNFSQLKVGNYWVYQQFDVDSSGNATPKNVYDSCYVEKDTIINGLTFLKIFNPSFISNYSFLRDSLHYLVDSNGQILFSSQDFSSDLSLNYVIVSDSDTVTQIIKKMADKNTIVNVPAGSFTTFNAKETFNMYPNWSFNGNVRYRHSRYAENIGIVVETLPFFVSNPNYIERRLVRYHIN